jgi:hypothetical protein
MMPMRLVKDSNGRGFRGNGGLRLEEGEVRGADHRVDDQARHSAVICEFAQSLLVKLVNDWHSGSGASNH